NGSGVAPEIRARIFEPYFSTKKNGTGLGLTIVNQIIEDHRGYVRVRPNEPRGTRFTIEFPASVSAAAEEGRRTGMYSLQAREEGVKEQALRKTILVVDDEEGVRESVREVLSDEGYRVVDTADGSRVIDLIKQEKPGLVLLDVWMPEIDGIGLLKEIKVQEPNLNVVMVSGHGNIHMAVTATKFGAFDFIEKPVSLDGLLLTVRRALGDLSAKQTKKVNGLATKKAKAGKTVVAVPKVVNAA